MLVASLGISAAHWESSSPLADLERVSLNWFGRMFSLPDEFLFSPEGMEMGHGGGCFTDNPGESMLLTVMAARTAKVNEMLGTKEQHYLFGKKTMGEIYVEADKISVYSKEKALPHLEAICEMAGVNWIAVEEMNKERLEDIIKADIEIGHRPGMVVLTLNKDLLGQMEDITKIAKK